MPNPLLISLLVAAAPGQRVLVDRVVAVVNEDVITLSELEAAAKPFIDATTTTEKLAALRSDLLEQLISERLLAQQVKEAKLEVTDDEVDRAMKDIIRQNQITEDELRQAVETRGMSMKQYKDDLRSQLIRLKIVDLKVRSRVSIPEADLKAEFERRQRDEQREELVHIRHLFFRWGESPDSAERARVLGEARRALERVKKGEPFDEVAKQVSEGPTAAQGGDLGELGAGSLLPELARGIRGLAPGAVSDPIETANGVHVVKVEGRSTKAAVEYASVRDQLYQQLYAREVDRQMKLWLDELRSQSSVELRP